MGGSIKSTEIMTELSKRWSGLSESEKQVKKNPNEIKEKPG